MKRLKVPGHVTRLKARRAECEIGMMDQLKEIFKQCPGRPTAWMMGVLWSTDGVSFRAAGGRCDIIGLFSNAKVLFTESTHTHEKGEHL